MKILIEPLKSALKAWVDLQEKDFTSLEDLQHYAFENNCEQGICFFLINNCTLSTHTIFEVYYDVYFHGDFITDPICKCYSLKTALESIEYRIQWLKKEIEQHERSKNNKN